MKVSEFANLIAIWGLSSLDNGPKVLTFRKDANDQAIVQYQGLHVGGQRLDGRSVVVGFNDRDPKAERIEEFAVSGAFLSGVLGLFPDDADIKVGVRDAKMHIRCGTAKNQLALLHLSGDGGLDTDTEVEATLELRPADLLDAISILAEVTAKNAANPVLTGIQFSVVRGKLRLIATDGFRACLTQISPDAARGPFATILQADDLLAALPLLGESCSIQMQTGSNGASGERIVLQDGPTRIRLSPLMGKPPDLARLPTKFAGSMNLPSGVLSVMARAASLLDENKLCKITVIDGSLTLSVEGETGAMTTSLGAGYGDAFTVHINAGALGFIEKLGEEVKLSYNGSREPLLLSGKGFKYYVTPSAYNG